MNDRHPGGRRPTCLPPYAKASGGKPSRSSKSVGWVIQKYHVNQCVSLIATLAALIRNDNFFIWPIQQRSAIFLNIKKNTF
jgi:hypothetical protein